MDASIPVNRRTPVGAKRFGNARRMQPSGPPSRTGGGGRPLAIRHLAGIRWSARPFSRAGGCAAAGGGVPIRRLTLRERSDEDPFNDEEPPGFACRHRRARGGRGPCRPICARPPRRREVRAGLHRALRRPDPRGAARHRHQPLLPHRGAAAPRPRQRPALRHHLERPRHPAALGHRAHRGPERRLPRHPRRERGARRAQHRAPKQPRWHRGAGGRADADPGRRRRLAGERLLGRRDRQGAHDGRHGRPRARGDHRAEPGVQPLRVDGGRRVQRGAERERRRQHGLGRPAR